MVVNKEGDLELYAVHDTPKPTPWSSRGDLGVALSCSYRVFPGVRDLSPPPEPWDIQHHSSAPGSKAQSVDRYAAKEESISRGRTAHTDLSPPPLFGRGDEDGFPALPVKPPASLSTSRPGRSRTYSPAALRHLQFEHSALTRQQPRRHPVTSDATAPPSTMADTLSLNGGSPPQKHHHGHVHHGGKMTTGKALQHLVEEDISMTMRQRVVQGYGLTNVRVSTASQAHALMCQATSLFIMLRSPEKPPRNLHSLSFGGGSTVRPRRISTVSR